MGENGLGGRAVPSRVRRYHDAVDVAVESLVGSGQNQFDPADHTVPEVMDHLRAHPDEASAIIAAEKLGKARSTILDHVAE